MWVSRVCLVVNLIRKLADIRHNEAIIEFIDKEIQQKPNACLRMISTEIRSVAVNGCTNLLTKPFPSRIVSFNQFFCGLRRRPQLPRSARVGCGFFVPWCCASARDGAAAPPRNGAQPGSATTDDITAPRRSFPRRTWRLHPRVATAATPAAHPRVFSVAPLRPPIVRRATRGGLPSIVRAI